MSAVIDTLEIAHELRRAGVPEPQAEAIARIFKRRYDADREELVTRAYLDHALEKLSIELRSELKAELARLERDLIMKLGGIIALVGGIVGALGVLS